MSDSHLSSDEKWPRANTLFEMNLSNADIAIIGVPAYETSLSANSAKKTPDAIRDALARYSTYSGSHDVDLRKLTFADWANVDAPDHADGEIRVATAVARAREHSQLLVALGGDNSITYSVLKGMWQNISEIGLITLDAHHDMRDGVSNGSPVWRLMQAGLMGSNIVQIGINDFANSPEYAARAREHGVHIIYRDALRKRPMDDVMAEALDRAGAGGREIYVDIDVDVCDRAIAPACPASMPGGLSADELRQAAYLAGADRRVRGLDITEIDVNMDAPDQRTVRLAALLVLEASSGVAAR